MWAFALTRTDEMYKYDIKISFLVSSKYAYNYFALKPACVFEYLFTQVLIAPIVRELEWLWSES